MRARQHPPSRSRPRAWALAWTRPAPALLLTALLHLALLAALLRPPPQHAPADAAQAARPAIQWLLPLASRPAARRTAPISLLPAPPQRARRAPAVAPAPSAPSAQPTPPAAPVLSTMPAPSVPSAAAAAHPDLPPAQAITPSAPATEPGFGPPRPSAADILNQARRDIGKIDRELRKVYPERERPRPDSMQARLEQGIGAAHDAVPPKWYEGAKTVELSQPDSKARIYKIITALGAFCVTINQEGRRSYTNCPP